MNRLRGLSEKTKAEIMAMSVEEIYNTGYVAGKADVDGPTVHEQWDALPKKSPNQQRAELIQRAREFVEVKLESLKDSPDIEGGWNFKKRENPNFCHFISSIEFIVNAEKRTVVALLKYMGSKEVESKGIAKCMPDEVFNADIGKAIALARALEIPYPSDFRTAVQPTEKVVGMTVEYENRLFRLVPKHTGTGMKFKLAHVNSTVGRESTIIDDTNAKYSEHSK